MFRDSSLLNQSFPASVRRFWKVSGKSNLKRIVREVYFRSDIGCGLSQCEGCSKSQVQGTLDYNAPLLILTTELVMKHPDVCDKFLKNCVIPATVSNELRRRSLNVHARLKKMVQRCLFGGFYLFSNENLRETYVVERPEESVIDRDNRAVYECARWYCGHLPGNQVYLVTLTNSPFRTNSESVTGDVDMDRPSNLRVVDLYELHDLFPELFEGMLEHLPKRDVDKGAQEREKTVYPAHLSEPEVQEGLERGELFLGVLHMYIGSYQRGYVSCGKEEFRVTSLLNLNRALDGDHVAVQLVDSHDADAHDAGSYSKLAVSLEDKVGTEDTDVGLVDAHMDPTQFKVLKRHCRVVAITKAGRREFCGSLLPLENVGSEGYSDRVFIPVDARIPFIAIETKRSKQLDNKRIVVRVDGWDRTARRPQGHWTEIIGDIDDRDVEAEVILREHEVITDDFSLKSYRELNDIADKLISPKHRKRTLDQVNSSSDQSGHPDPDGGMEEDGSDKHEARYAGEGACDIEITRELLANRVDYRNELVFSVDPPGCMDIDDALGCKKLKNGNFEVSVHIADVTHFVHEGSNLDREASDRCTTVYLVDRRTDMLPKLLTTNLCSLMENVNRLTFSVFWEIDPNGLVLATRFSKSVIRSRRALSYQQAQDMIDSSSNNEVCTALRNLNSIAKILRQQRMNRGAVELESSEVKFEFDVTKVTNLESYRTYDTNKMVEEFMLLANISVATKIYERFPKFALLRIHPPPFEEKLNELNRTLQQQNIRDFKFGNSKQLNESLELVKRAKSDKFVTATKILTTRTMSQAVYKNSNDLGEGEFKHYGLCCEYYTHFTSPIRRYADVIVHRLLAAALDQASLSTNLTNNLSTQCDVLNRRHRNAQWCSRDSDKMFSYLYFKQMESVECVGIVLDVNEDRLVVLTLKYGIEAVANVPYRSFDKLNKRLVDESGHAYKVFDQVKIRLYACNRHFRNMIKADLICPVT